jgi:hypothetical protein
MVIHGPEFPSFNINLTYSDIANRTYQKSFEVDIERQLGQNLSSDKGIDPIVEELKDIAKEVKELHKAITKIKN